MFDGQAFSKVIVRFQGLRSNRSLARAIGVSEGTFSRWRRGDVVPKRESWPRLAEALGLTFDELVDALQREAAGEGAGEERGADRRALREIDEHLAEIRRRCSGIEAVVASLK
jgi:transcriptional regulator with XRE-family HTH domain